MFPTTTRRLRILGTVFVCVVIGVVVYTHQLLIPVFLGLFTWGKAWLKSLTPKLGMLVLKNGAVIQARRLMMQASTHVLVKSHRPWRRKITAFRLKALAVGKSAFSGYLAMPLWLRTLIAICVLLVTAGSSFAIFALLIIPQPVLNWLKQRVTVTMNKLGVTKLSSALWKFMTPQTLRHRLHMHMKWTVGRQQVRTAKRVHQTVVNKAVILKARSSNPITEAIRKDDG